MSVKSSNSIPGGETVVRAGYLKKLKTFKKKYFVLRAEGPESSARLEYYDSEKKFNNGQPPKRSIPLKTCFNINKRIDTKHKHVIALYTKDDCFCIVLENEDDLEAWLKALLSLQHGEEAADGETPRPTFEHVWQVTVLNRGLGGTSVIGAYSKAQDSAIFRLCLTDKTLSLIRKDRESPQAELSLSSIRSCGSLKNFFYLEVGRSSVTGAGELWMETEDANIAQNVHQTVFHAMSSSSSSKDELGPPRIRSSSATESSKPGRKQTHGGVTKYHHAQDTNCQVNETLVPASTSTTHIAVSWVSCMYQHLYHRSASRASQRRHSISAGGVPWPKTVNHQRTQSLPLAQFTPLTEQPLQPKRAAKRSNQSFRCTAGNCRERCDSMPSRARTSSEGTHPIHTWGQPRLYLAPHRPQSLYVREISHSPPVESPISPPSAACSTDSAGSSLSIDDSEQWAESDTILGRYGHSLTPDEAIAEENYDDCPDSPYLPQGTSPSGYLPMAPISSDDGYVDMSPRGRHANMSPAASTSSVTSGTPSTDMRFAEYPLEKVSAYFTPSEEEKSSVDRPIRAYSVGSRPDTIKTKTRYEMSTTPENARVRAFSVGSKTRKLHARVLPPHGTHIHPKPKSSSAPLLSGSRVLMSHNSQDPMNDLMELDFSKPMNAGYMDMNATNKVPSGYVEMKPGIYEATHTHDVSPYVDMRSSSSPAKTTSDYIPIQAPKPNIKEYVDMDTKRPSNRIERSNTRTKETRISDSPSARHSDYLDMNFQSRSKPKYDDSPMDGYMDYTDMAYQPNHNNNIKPTTTEGYVEMSLGKQNSRHTNYDRALPDSSDDYTDMSMGSSRKNGNERRGNKTTQPISIQAAATTSSQFPKNSSSISPIYSSYHMGRKFSSETSPKMYLPLTNNSELNAYSSLPRQRSRKNSRRDSKDSSSSSINTPSSSSTIFPISLNSPSSPLKSGNAAKTPDVSSNNIKIPAAIINVKYNRPSFSQSSRPQSVSDYTVMDFDSKPKATPDTSDYVNYNPAVPNPVKCNRTVESGDYAVMRPGSLEIARTTTTTEPKISIPVSSPSTLTTQLSSMVLGQSALSYDFGMSGTRCFLPISEGRDDTRLGTMSPRPGDLAPTRSSENVHSMEESDYVYGNASAGPDCQSPVAKISRPNSVSCEITRAMSSRPSSAASEFGSSSSTIVGSRPASVNSDRIRPASVNIEGQLHYASLDLAPTCEEEGSRSPRTVKSTSVSTNANEISNTSPTQPLPETTGFTYAEIDFIKSEGFKHNTLPPNNAKVKY